MEFDLSITYVIGQVLVGLAISLCTFSMYMKKRNMILFHMMLAQVLFSLSYLFLGAYTAMATNLIGIAQVAVFRKKGCNKFMKTEWPFYIFLFLYLWVSYLTWSDNSYCFLALNATLVITISVWNDNPTWIRVGQFLAGILWGAYNFFFHSYVGFILEICLSIGTLVSIIRIDILGKKAINDKLF